jgi:hypothetical protein
MNKASLLTRFEDALVALCDASEKAKRICQKEADSYNRFKQLVRDHEGRSTDRSDLNERCQARNDWRKDRLCKRQIRRTLVQAMDSAKALATEAVAAVAHVRKTELSTRDEFQVAAKELVCNWHVFDEEATWVLARLDDEKPRNDEPVDYDAVYRWVLARKFSDA